MTDLLDSGVRETAPSRSVLDLLGLLARLVLVGAMLWAGIAKIVEGPAVAARAVQAFRLLPYDFAAIVGFALPYVEVILGLLLLAGLFTRWAAAAVSLLLVAFIAGIASAWARGLSIDCGCFGGGGDIAPAETQYPLEIVRDLALLAGGLLLIRRPRTPLALDRMWA